MITKIYQNDMDSIGADVAKVLRSYGIQLNDNLEHLVKCKLEDALFMDCGINTTSDEDKSAYQEVQIAFDFDDSTAHQKVRIIDPDYTEERIIEEMTEGYIEVNLDYDVVGPSLTNVKTGKTIGYVISQEINETEARDIR